MENETDMRLLGDLDLDVDLLLFVSDGSPTVAEATVVPEFNDVSMVQGITMVNRCYLPNALMALDMLLWEVVPKKVAEEKSVLYDFANWESSPQM